METSIINKNAIFRELIVKYGTGSNFTYLKVSNAIEGLTPRGDTKLTDNERLLIIDLIREASEEAINNIKSSLNNQ